MRTLRILIAVTALFFTGTALVSKDGDPTESEVDLDPLTLPVLILAAKALDGR